MQDATTEKLRHDLTAVVEDAEELLKATAGQTGERVERVRARAQESLHSARVRLVETRDALTDKAKAAAVQVDGTVREHPWTALGIAAGVGLVVGFLLRKR